jgi:hypothetical protein
MTDRIDPSTWPIYARSNGSGSACVEAGRGHDVVGVRDSKDRTIGPLVFGKMTWASFVQQVKAGQYDL